MSGSWWRASLRARPLARLLSGWSAPLIWTGAGLTASGCADILSETEPDRTQAALEAQQQDGWSVGDEGQPLAFPSAQLVDISGGAGWREALSTLAPPAFARRSRAGRRTTSPPCFSRSKRCAAPTCGRPSALFSLPRWPSPRAAARHCSRCSSTTVSAGTMSPSCSTSRGPKRWHWLRRSRPASTRCSSRQLAAPERSRAHAPDARRRALLLPSSTAHGRPDRPARRQCSSSIGSAWRRTPTTPVCSTTATSPACRLATPSRRPGSGSCST